MGLSDYQFEKVWLSWLYGHFPNGFQDNELGNLYLGQLFMAVSTFFRPQHNDNQLVKHTWTFAGASWIYICFLIDKCLYLKLPQTGLLLLEHIINCWTRH